MKKLVLLLFLIGLGWKATAQVYINGTVYVTGGNSTPTLFIDCDAKVYVTGDIIFEGYNSNSTAFIHGPIYVVGKWINETDDSIVDVNDCDATAIVSPQATTVEIKIYPNPTNGDLNVRSNFGGSVELRVFDNMGRLVINVESVMINSLAVRTSALSPGTYFIRFRSAEFTETKEFIKLY